jgi:serine phosphatase RsbU (regulator of sigma subunit)
LAFVAVVGVLDFVTHSRAVFLGFLALAPLFTAAVDNARRTALVTLAASAVALSAGVANEIFGSVDHALRVVVVIAVGVVAVYVARARDVRELRLSRLTEIAQAAQRAVLRAVPDQVGEVAFAARYLSAYETAEVGGDFYEVVASPYGVRALVGDVCGKGLGGVRLAATLTGAFRQSAFQRTDLSQVAADLDRAVVQDGDLTAAGALKFATAVLVEFRSSELVVVNCGHPSPVLRKTDGGVQLLHPPGRHPPLGLGARLRAPGPGRHAWRPGDRLLLYTDGLVEARDSHRGFLELRQIYPRLAAESREDCLDGVITDLLHHAGGRTGDDTALLLAEYRPYSST